MSQADIDIRIVDASHCDLLAALHAECFEKAWNPDSFATLLGMPGSLGALARDTLDAANTTEPAGYVLALDTGSDWEILSLGVRPEHRRRGIARALIDAVLTQMPKQQPRALVLEVAADNHPAQQLYDGLGFQPVGRRPRYYRRGGTAPVDALILRLAP